LDYRNTKPNKNHVNHGDESQDAGDVIQIENKFVLASRTSSGEKSDHGTTVEASG
jgi:hypothetical protein